MLQKFVDSFVVFSVTVLIGNVFC